MALKMQKKHILNGDIINDLCLRLTSLEQEISDLAYHQGLKNLEKNYFHDLKSNPSHKIEKRGDYEDYDSYEDYNSYEDYEDYEDNENYEDNDDYYSVYENYEDNVNYDIYGAFDGYGHKKKKLKPLKYPKKVPPKKPVFKKPKKKVRPKKPVFKKPKKKVPPKKPVKKKTKKKKKVIHKCASSYAGGFAILRNIFSLRQK